MYNPYIVPPPPQEQGQERAAEGAGENSGAFGGLFGFLGKKQKDAGLAGILKLTGLDGVDMGDVLLLLILLLLVSEGDEAEMVVTLGLVLLMGLAGRERNQEG